VAIAQAASSLASRDVFNSNLGHQARNKDVLRLGEEIGSAVMGPEQWKLYITTSPTEMAQGHKPWIRNKTEALATKRFPGEREGWGLHRVGRTTPGWAMTNEITFTLPSHTEENPLLHGESL